eukprot:5699535-Pyramimonas_sp.AAC.1
MQSLPLRGPIVSRFETKRRSRLSVCFERGCKCAGFGLDAYVCVGKDATGGAAWVVTRTGGGNKAKHTATVWDPLTALRYGGGGD